MQVILVMFKADGDRRSFSLPRDVTLIGRREDCDLRIPLGEVSRKHCRLIKEADSLRLEDLGSSNGSFHNGVRVQEAIVQPGDVIQVGPVAFTIQIDGVPTDEEIQAPVPLTTDTTPADEGPGELEELEELPDAEDAEELISTMEPGAGGSHLANDLVDFDPMSALEPPPDSEDSQIAPMQFDEPG